METDLNNAKNEYLSDLFESDKVICSNFADTNKELFEIRAASSFGTIRNLVEAMAKVIYLEFKCEPLEMGKKGTNMAIKYISSDSRFLPLYKLHQLLQYSVSHKTLPNGESERFFRLIEDYLFKIKKIAEERINISILTNFPFFEKNCKPQDLDYYRQISNCLSSFENFDQNSVEEFFCYIKKVNSIIIDKKVFYEITLSIADDSFSKTNTFLGYSKIEMLSNYAVKLKMIKKEIPLFATNVQIFLILKYEVSIRHCEYINFASILGPHNSNFKTNETKELHNYLTMNKLTYVDIINFDDIFYEQFESEIKSREKVKVTPILEMLSKCREFVKKQVPGSNMIKFLLNNLRNKIIKDQLSNTINGKLSNLFLSSKCIPFDSMPLASCPINNIPSLYSLMECFEINGREYELLARKISSDSDENGVIYHDLVSAEVDRDFANKFNSFLYSTHLDDRKIVIWNNKIYINSYEKTTKNIIERLNGFTNEYCEQYAKTIDALVLKNDKLCICQERNEIYKTMFRGSRLAMIYGNAGTGKTTFIAEVADIFKSEKCYFIADTNPAVQNLKNKVGVGKNRYFFTINKLLYSNSIEKSCNILFIDECSTISNKNMNNLLEDQTFDYLICVGDVNQIESIQFGNWFNVSQIFLSEKSRHYLKKIHRTDDNNLLKLWKMVSESNEGLSAHITSFKCSETFNENIFIKTEDDEIVLCLNYDGIYGINNIQKILQSKNPEKKYQWTAWVYKKNDPIVFNENNIFKEVFHNNLKGKIVEINMTENSIQFTLEVYKEVTEKDYCLQNKIEIITTDYEKSTVKFFVYKKENFDSDEIHKNTEIPFNIAYAISIHKAQGLEYSSVKIVIADDSDEKINRNIFYTAITRAKKSLKIFWSPETEAAIIKKILSSSKNCDISILKEKVFPKFSE